MKDTVRIATISIDTERIQRDIYAESACIALMSTTKRPEILTGDRRKLIEIYIRNAITEFVAKFCAFIDGNSLNLEEAGTLQQIPVIMPEDTKISPQIIRRIIESIITAHVLSACYEPQPEIHELLAERYERHCSQLRIALK